MKTRKFLPNLKSESKKEIQISNEKNVNDEDLKIESVLSARKSEEEVVHEKTIATSSSASLSSPSLVVVAPLITEKFTEFPGYEYPIESQLKELNEVHQIPSMMVEDSLPHTEFVEHVHTPRRILHVRTPIMNLSVPPLVNLSFPYPVMDSIPTKKIQAILAARNYISHINETVSSQHHTPTIPIKKRRRESSSSSHDTSFVSNMNQGVGVSVGGGVGGVGSEGVNGSNGDAQYLLLTRYVIRRRQGLGLRLRSVFGRAVVGGFTEEYLNNHISSQATDIQIGDIIMAVDNVDTSNPIHCPFNKTIKYLQGAGDVREKPTSLQQVHLGDDPLQMTQRLTSSAKFHDTVTIRIARLVNSEYARECQ